MSTYKPDIFALAKSVDMPEYLESHYGHEFDKKMRTVCPFHNDTHPSASVKLLDTWVFTCFACGWSGNLIDYVMTREKMR